MKPRVYIETSVPSFYHEVRPEPEMVARRAWTREWWDGHREAYEVVTSVAVIEELEAGDHPRGDALHLALASYHRCRFLLTWNCAHLANANKQEHIRHVNVLQGLHVPTSTTPLQLIRPQEADA